MLHELHALQADQTLSASERDAAASLLKWAQLHRKFDDALDKRGLSAEERTRMLDEVRAEYEKAAEMITTGRVYNQSLATGQTGRTISAVLQLIDVRRHILEILRAHGPSAYLCDRALSTDALECCFSMLREKSSNLTATAAMDSIKNLQVKLSIRLDPNRGFHWAEPKHTRPYITGDNRPQTSSATGAWAELHSRQGSYWRRAQVPQG